MKVEFNLAKAKWPSEAEYKKRARELTALKKFIMGIHPKDWRGGHYNLRSMNMAALDVLIQETLAQATTLRQIQRGKKRVRKAAK
jgi:hypothetical protein